MNAASQQAIRSGNREAVDPAGCPSPKLHPVGKWLISRLWSGENPSLMITLLLHLLRLFPFLSFAKMVMGLRPTLHHEIRLSFPLRRRPDTSMVCGTSSPSQN